MTALGLGRGPAPLRGLMAAAILLFAAAGALAQESAEEGASDVEKRRQLLEDFDPGATEDLAFPEAPAPSAMSQDTAAAYQAALQSYYDYRKRGYEHRLSVFWWQSLSTQIIFYIVLGLVFAGIYFAAIQFHVGLRRRRDVDESSAHPGETEISLSLGEFKVRSPVLGVIILTISLAFFYLYLVHVYPVRNVF